MPEPESPAARAARYPFAQPAGSYVFTRAGALPLVDPRRPWDADAPLADGARTVSWGALQEGLGIPDAPRTAVLGYGSNPSPETMARKLRAGPAGPVAVPVLALEVHDLDAVWSAHVHAGYVPATIARSPGTVLRAWALLLTDAELDVVNASESLGVNYALGRLTGARATYADGRACEELLGYVSLHGALDLDGGPLAVDAVAADRRTFPACDEPEVLRRVHARTGAEAPYPAFAAALADDPAAARACTEGLRPTSRAFAWPGWVPLVPPG